MIINQASLRGLDVSYSTAYNKALEETKTYFEMIATTVPSSTAENNYTWLGQIPQMREWIGEREIQSMSVYDYSIKNLKFEMTISVPRDAIEDDQYGLYTPSFSGLGESVARKPDDLCFKTLREGFSKKCFDNMPFFSDSHKSGERTFSNLSHEKLSREAYIRARASIMSLVGDKGHSLGLIPNLLVVSPANEEMANMILKAEQINGTSNVYRGTAEILVSTQLAEMPDAWFLLCTSRFLKPIIYQTRRPVKIISYNKETDPNVFYKDEYIWGADGRFNVGYGYWQMAYGSDGAVESAAKG